jgi:hypothetical protein
VTYEKKDFGVYYLEAYFVSLIMTCFSSQGEIKLPVLMEDEAHKELPSIHLLYRPVRQMVYAILFNLHHYMYMASKSKENGGEY